MGDPAFHSHRPAWFHRFDLNPVFIKEIRQAVRSLALTSVFLLMLSGLALISLLMLAAQDGNSRQAGEELFGFLLVVLNLALTFNAMVMLARTHRERDSEGVDLLYITTLTPGQIVRGKLLASCAHAAMLLATGLPFLVLCYLLRGISLATIGGGVLRLLLCAIMMNLFALLCACFRGPLLAKIVFFCLLLLSLFFVWNTGRSVSVYVLPVLAELYIIILALTLIYSLIIFMLSHVASNRAKPFRLTLNIIHLSIVFILFYTYIINNERYMFDILIPLVTSILLLFGLVLGLPSKDQLSRRIQAELPRGITARILLLPFCDNRLAVLVWFVLTAAITLLGLMAVKSLINSSINPYAFGLAWFYFLAYALSAHSFETWFGRFFRKTKITERFIFFPIIVAITIFALSIDFSNNAIAHLNWPALGDPFFFFYSGQMDDFAWHHFIFLSLWLLILLILNRKWIQEVLRQFFPVTRPLPPPLPVERVDG